MKVFVLFFCSIHRLSYDEKTRRKLDCLFSKNKKRLRGFSSFELNTAMNYHTLSREKPRFLPVGRGGAQVQRSTKLLDDDAGPTLTREGITTTKCILKKKENYTLGWDLWPWNEKHSTHFILPLSFLLLLLSFFSSCVLWLSPTAITNGLSWRKVNYTRQKKIFFSPARFVRTCTSLGMTLSSSVRSKSSRLSTPKCPTHLVCCCCVLPAVKNGLLSCLSLLVLDNT